MKAHLEIQINTATLIAKYIEAMISCAAGKFLHDRVVYMDAETNEIEEIARVHYSTPSGVNGELIELITIVGSDASDLWASYGASPAGFQEYIDDYHVEIVERAQESLDEWKERAQENLDEWKEEDFKQWERS